MMNDTNNRVSANRRETMIIKLYFKHEKSGTKLYAGDASHRRILVWIMGNLLTIGCQEIIIRNACMLTIILYVNWECHVLWTLNIPSCRFRRRIDALYPLQNSSVHNSTTHTYSSCSQNPLPILFNTSFNSV